MRLMTSAVCRDAGSFRLVATLSENEKGTPAPTGRSTRDRAHISQPHACQYQPFIKHQSPNVDPASDRLAQDVRSSDEGWLPLRPVSVDPLLSPPRRVEAQRAQQSSPHWLQAAPDDRLLTMKGLSLAALITCTRFWCSFPHRAKSSHGLAHHRIRTRQPQLGRETSPCRSRQHCMQPVG
jgi:hypothetical protein